MEHATVDDFVLQTTFKIESFDSKDSLFSNGDKSSNTVLPSISWEANSVKEAYSELKKITLYGALAKVISLWIVRIH